MGDFEITELNRRVANLIKLGTVAEIDFETARVRVQIGELLTGWLPWLTLRAGNDRTWWAPESNEQVVVLSPGGDLAQGVVLLGLYQDVHPAPADTPSKHRTLYADGAVIEYDRDAHHLDARLPGSGTVTLQADGGVTIIGDVAITGNVSVTGEVSATDVTAGVSLKTHKHLGGSGGPVGTPIP